MKTQNSNVWTHKGFTKEIYDLSLKEKVIERQKQVTRYGDICMTKIKCKGIRLLLDKNDEFYWMWKLKHRFKIHVETWNGQVYTKVNIIRKEEYILEKYK